MAVIIGHASIDERGKANSGQAGDQRSEEHTSELQSLLNPDLV